MLTVSSEKLYRNRFSILLAFLALSFGMLYLLPIQGGVEPVNIFGFEFRFDFINFIPLLLALLAAAGSIWVFSVHPVWQNEDYSLYKLLPNLALPFLSILILAIVLMQSNRSLIWWAVFLTGFLIIVLLLRAEYMLIGASEKKNIWYSMLVISFSFGLFLLFTIALKNSSIRMFAQFFLIFIAGLFVVFRYNTLMNLANRKSMQVLLLAWITAQLAVALHYVFINPIQYGLILTGLLYAISSWMSQYQPTKKWHQYKEPLVMVLITVFILILSSII